MTRKATILTGVCLAIHAALLLTNVLTGVALRPPGATLAAIARSGFVAPVFAAITVGSVLAIVQLLGQRTAALVGAALTITGAAVGTRITLLMQLSGAARLGLLDVPERLQATIQRDVPLLWASIVPSGLCYPLGWMTLGIALFFVRPVNRWIGVLLAVGGLLFPVGRAVGVPWAVTASDLVLGSALALLAWNVLAKVSPANEKAGVAAGLFN